MIKSIMCLCFLFALQGAAQSTDDLRPAESTVPAQTTGEATSPKICIPSNTQGYAGDPALIHPEKSPVTGPKTMGFGADIHVRSNNLSTYETHQSMASDYDGNLYVAWEDSHFITYTYIQIYKSSDGGETWKPYGYVKETGVDLKTPSIAIGEGAEDLLLLTYIRDDRVNMSAPEVASTDLDNPGNWNITYVPVWSGWDGYAKPVINTDSHKHAGWYAYLTCEGIVNSSVSNINICTWRSTNRNVSWKDEFVLFGNYDGYAYLDPDQSYGTSQQDLFLVCYNDNDDSIYFAHSEDAGASWKTAKSLFTLTHEPAYPVDPEIAAAVNNDNLLIACTMSYKSNDNIGYAFSMDLGGAWSSLYNMKGHTTDYEFGVSLNANEAGNSWHLAWSSLNSICYSSRPQDLSSNWSSPTVVNDLLKASISNKKKAVASVWNTDAPCVCWTDFRDVNGDYDTYADFPENIGLATDTFKIHCSEGGCATMTLNAGVSNMNRHSLIFGSATGTLPGTPLPGGAVLPLNWDVFTNLALEFVNSPTFSNFYGKHDANGKRTATFNIHPFLGGPYVKIHFAFAMMDPWNYTSNPITMMIKP